MVHGLRLLVFALFSTLAAVHAEGAGKLVQPADIVALTQVNQVQLAPDGSRLAYVVSAASGSSIWLADSQGKQPPRALDIGDGEASSPLWSPDGASIAFLRQPSSSAGKPRGKQLWLASLAEGKVKSLDLLQEHAGGFRWSHDGRRIAFLRKDALSSHASPSPDTASDAIELDRWPPRNQLWVYDLITHQARPLTHSNENIVDFSWSPDDSHIAASMSPTARTDDIENVLSIVTIDATSGDIDRHLPGYASTHKIAWSPDGSHIAFFRLAPTTDIGFLVLYDLVSGRERGVAADSEATIEDMAWGSDPRSLVALALRGTGYSFERFDVRSGDATVVLPLQGGVEKFSISNDGQTLAYVQETATVPGDIYVSHHNDEHRITHANPQVSTWQLGSERAIHWTSRVDGREISGVLLLPPHYDRSRRYKSAVLLHGGPASAWTLGFHGSWYDWGSVLASHGYVVLLPNPRGSEGGGVAFGMANDRHWGNAEFQDIMDGVDQLIADGVADPDRLVIGGWSYGGYLVAWTITHTNRFKAAVAGAAMTDLFSMATATDIAPSFLTRYFGPLDANIASYDAHSPARYLSNCQTPVLVMGGQADARVPFFQGEALYQGLRFMGKEAQMVLYPREPHFFEEQEHQRDSLERMLAWYEAHLESPQR